MICRLIRAVLVGWSAICLLLLAMLVGVRWLRYANWDFLAGIDSILAELMVAESQAFLWPWAYSTIKQGDVLLAAAILVAGLHRQLPPMLVRQTNATWHLTPLAVSLVASLMLWLHYGFDLNPFLTGICACSLPLVWLSENRHVRSWLPAPALLVVWSGLVLWWTIEAADWTDRLVIFVWCAGLLATHYWRSRIHRFDLGLIRVLGILPINLLSAVMPIVLPLHGGSHMGDGLAYSYCEVPGRGTVYAALPVCESVQPDYEVCRDGRFVEYDLETTRPVAQHRFFTPEFYGRLEMLACLDDEVLAAVQSTVFRGEVMIQTAMSFPVAAPEQFTPIVAGRGLGIVIAYDRKHDAIFYGAEFNNLLVRYDRRTRRFDDRASQDLSRPWIQPVSLQTHSGSVVLHTPSIHPARNRIYLADWLHGRWAYGVDLTTLQLVERYDVGGGGALGITVDPDRNRLFVSSLWGLEVIDLASGKQIARRRLGLGTRPVIVDAARNRLYVSSMVEGKIRVLDRDTFEVLGQIPIGIGSRFPYLSNDGRDFFASSTWAHYSWAADALPGS